MMKHAKRQIVILPLLIVVLLAASAWQVAKSLTVARVPDCEEVQCSVPGCTGGVLPCASVACEKCETRPGPCYPSAHMCYTRSNR